MQPKQNAIKLSIAEKLKIDPYYFERKKELEKLRADVESGKEKLVSWEDFKKDFEKFEVKIEKKCAKWHQKPF